MEPIFFGFVCFQLGLFLGYLTAIIGYKAKHWQPHRLPTIETLQHIESVKKLLNRLNRTWTYRQTVTNSNNPFVANYWDKVVETLRTDLTSLWDEMRA